MIHYFLSEKILFDEPRQLYCDEERKVLIFNRANTIFAFNFNPTASFENFSFWAPEGEYEMAFNSDEERFGGFSRLRKDEIHYTIDHKLALYLPSRCAVVLKKV